MIDVETARKAGGGSIPFTVAVAMIILLILGGIVWRVSHSEEPHPPTIAGR